MEFKLEFSNSNEEMLILLNLSQSKQLCQFHFQCWATSRPKTMKHLNKSVFSYASKTKRQTQYYGRTPLICTTHLNIVVNHIHYFIKDVLSDGCAQFQQKNVSLSQNVPHLKLLFSKAVKNTTTILASKRPRSQTDLLSVGCAGQTALIHTVPTVQFTELFARYHSTPSGV